MWSTLWGIYPNVGIFVNIFWGFTISIAAFLAITGTLPKTDG